jgi:hypothetical protein
VAAAVRALEHEAIVLDAHPVTAWINDGVGAALVRSLHERTARGEVRMRATVPSISCRNCRSSW